MIKVTQNARNRLFQLVSGNAGCRIKMSREGNLALVIDKASSDDQVVKFKGKPVLFVGKDVAQLVDGAVLDLKVREDGSHVLSLDI